MSDTSRRVCPRCRRPSVVCYCAHLVPLPTRTRIVILQHPREARVPIGTARMAHLMLPHSQLVHPQTWHSGGPREGQPEGRGVFFGERPWATDLGAEQAAGEGAAPPDSVALLFPGPGAEDPARLPPGAVKTLVVIDGTWAQARKVLKQNPGLLRLRRVGITPTRPGNYRIRREPAAECLATIEALAQALGVLEGEGAPERFAGMLAAFTFMVDQQLAHAAARTEPPRRWKHKTRQEQAAAQRREQLARAVVVQAEVNAHPRGSNLPGRAELLNLVARRVRTGERFAALLAPRRPLAGSTVFHLGLGEAELLAGETLAAVADRWAAFLRPTDVLCGWGSFTAEQLAAEGLRSGEWLDLRVLVAARLNQSPGSPPHAAQTLGAPPPPDEPLHPGRAESTVRQLIRIVNALLAP